MAATSNSLMTSTEKLVKCWMRERIQNGTAPRTSGGALDVWELADWAADEFTLYQRNNGVSTAQDRVMRWADELWLELED